MGSQDAVLINFDVIIGIGKAELDGPCVPLVIAGGCRDYS